MLKMPPKYVLVNELNVVGARLMHHVCSRSLSQCWQPNLYKQQQSQELSSSVCVLSNEEWKCGILPTTRLSPLLSCNVWPTASLRLWMGRRERSAHHFLWKPRSKDVCKCTLRGMQSIGQRWLTSSLRWMQQRVSHVLFESTFEGLWWLLSVICRHSRRRLVLSGVFKEACDTGKR